jgi:2-haloacid dehalogenase
MDYEHGKVAMGDMLNARFALTMQEHGVAVDGVEWEKRYQALLGGGHHIIEDAMEICHRLAKTHRLFVVTNGVRETQHKRLKLAGLHSLFEKIFDSQSIGYQKPDKAFFDHVKSHIDGFDVRHALIIGDSLNTDIKGGIVSGIDTCWFNKRSQQCHSDICSTYTITKLTELYDILALGDGQEDT